MSCLSLGLYARVEELLIFYFWLFFSCRTKLFCTNSTWVGSNSYTKLYKQYRDVQYIDLFWNCDLQYDLLVVDCKYLGHFTQLRTIWWCTAVVFPCLCRSVSDWFPCTICTFNKSEHFNENISFFFLLALFNHSLTFHIFTVYTQDNFKTSSDITHQ